jgi:uncharacterized membrane protein
MAEKKSFRWSKLILVASLGLNLVVVGVVAGAWVNGPKRGDRDMRSPSCLSGPFGRALSKEDRRAMGETFRGDENRKGKLNSQRREMRRIGADVTAVLRAEPFDRTALQVLFDQQVRIVSEQRGLGQEALLDRISAMTPQERAGFADRLEQGLKRGRPRDKKN